VSSRSLLWAALALAACAPRQIQKAAELPSSYPGGAAVLPFDNETTSLEAPVRLRKLVYARLGGPGSDRVDSALKGMGISEGGQLGAVTPAEIGAAVGAAALVYGKVEAFDYQNLGFVRRKIVRLKLKVVSAADGAVLWESTGEGRSSDATVKETEGKKRFFEGIVEQAAEKLLRMPLHEESQRAVNEVLGSYPWR